MPAAVWPAEDTPAESKAAPYANKAPQTGPTGSQAPHSPALGSFAADDPPRSAPPAGCTKKALPILAARREDRKRSEEHTSELQSRQYLVCRLLLEKKKQRTRESVSSRAILAHPRPGHCSHE